MTLEEQLIRDEGMRLKPYRDATGTLTIGVGRNLDANGITREEAIHLLANDVAGVQAELERYAWPRALNAARFNAIINMAFNLGVPRLLGFTQMITALERQDWNAAALAMLESRWAHQVGARAARLAQQMRDGTELV